MYHRHLFKYSDPGYVFHKCFSEFSLFLIGCSRDFAAGAGAHPRKDSGYSERRNHLPTLRSILPPLLSRIARAFDLRLIFSGSGRRTATTVRAPEFAASFAAGASGGLTFDISWPMAPRTGPLRVKPMSAPRMIPIRKPINVAGISCTFFRLKSTTPKAMPPNTT